MIAQITFLGDMAPLSGKVDVKLDRGYYLANLEGSILSDKINKLKMWPKAGPHIAHRVIPAIPGHVYFALANNHLMDYGLEGLKMTCDSLATAGIAYCGAGFSEEEARAPMIIDLKGIRLGVLSCCERQFGAALYSAPGVCCVGPWIYAAIHSLKKEVDHVVVSIHGAAEMSPWPTPEWQDLLRSFIDGGATVVHGHHSHVPQGYEKYHDGLICYGLGNFIADPETWGDFPDSLWSLSVGVDFRETPINIHMNTITIERASRGGVSIRPSTDTEQDNHESYLRICNKPLHDRALLAGLWQEISFSLYETHFAKWLGWREKSVWEDVPVNLLGRLRMTANAIRDVIRGSVRHYRPGSESAMLRYHLLACESHRAVLTEVLGVMGGEIRDLRTDETRKLVNKLRL